MVAISTSTYVNSTDTPMELALTWVPTVFTLANFFVSVRVRNEVAAKSVVEILKEIKRIQTEKC